jgi:hypothetical protein
LYALLWNCKKVIQYERVDTGDYRKTDRGILAIERRASSSGKVVDGQ